jgi:immunity protein 27 of polymorphic toxin system
VLVQISPEETKLVGQWEYVDGAVRSDAVANRIAELTKSYLVKIAVGGNGWEILYRDPSDLRFWELTYPESGSHGGGPPTLTHISMEHAQSKYVF